MVNIAMIMVVLRCVSRSIVLDSRLRSLSRCTLTAGRKQNPQKVESKALHNQQNSNGANIALFMGVLFALHQKPNKTEAEQMRTFARLLQVLPASRQPQPIPTQNASRRQPFIFRRIQSQKGGYFKAITIPKNTSSNCTIQRTIFYAIFYCLFFNLFLHFWLLCGIL